MVVFHPRIPTASHYQYHLQSYKIKKNKKIHDNWIEPSSPTPDHLRHYQLSFIDQVSPQFFMPWVLFYPKDTNFNLNNHEQRERIKKSLSEALTQFYPLAGRVKDGLYVECNDNGVPCVEAVAKCELSEFLENPNLSTTNSSHINWPMSMIYSQLYKSPPSTVVG